MNYKIFVLCLILITGLIGPVAAADIASDSGSTDSDIQISVTDITIDPEVFIQGDTGTITIEVTNSGDTGVAISSADLTSNDFGVLNDQTYDSVGTLGAGLSMSLTFTVKADCADGIYYLKFYMDYRDSGCFRYYIPVQVESSGVVISVVDAPDAYTAGKTDSITLLIGNIRENTVNGVTVSAEGNGVTTNQTVGFIGTLDSDGSSNIGFEITPSEETDLTFTVSYRNGINNHYTALTIPLVFGEEKIRPEPVVNNIEIVSSGGTYTVTGDITNAGLDNAYSIVVTVDSPAEGVDPLPLDVVGALEPDDFSSFEVTFTAQGSTSIPLLITYKDEDGNSYEKTIRISLNSNSSSTVPGDDSSDSGSTNSDTSSMMMQGPGGGSTGRSSFGSGLNSIPIVEIVVVIIAGVVAVIAWRKGYFTKIRARLNDRFRKKK